MFSEQLKKMDEMPYKTMWGVAACLVILCQLLAMVLVVQGQVRKAEIRDSSLDSRRMAIAKCNEAASAAARQSCVQQTLAAFSSPPEPEAANQAQALASPASFERGDAAAGKAQGLMPASYTIR
ncbi:MAG: hypothetical protein ABIV07_05595 [Polaromonas sp.]